MSQSRRNNGFGVEPLYDHFQLRVESLNYFKQRIILTIIKNFHRQKLLIIKATDGKSYRLLKINKLFNTLSRRTLTNYSRK